MSGQSRRADDSIEMRGQAFVFGATGREEVTLRDLSRKSIGVRIERPVCVGETLRVVLSLDGQTWTDLHGVVRYADRVGDAYIAGIEFEGSAPGAIARVETYLRRMRARVEVARRAAGSGSFRMVRDGTGKLKAIDPSGGKDG